jgi:hypothetical protein
MGLAFVKQELSYLRIVIKNVAHCLCIIAACDNFAKVVTTKHLQQVAKEV